MTIKLRPAVQTFAEAMEKKLRKHDKDRGSDGWLNESNNYLLERAFDEWIELREATQRLNTKNTRQEAVDLANFAMMIFDRAI